ncbi:MAG: hypothetical protein AAFX94_11440 [Myxococcota bacterium]
MKKIAEFRVRSVSVRQMRMLAHIALLALLLGCESVVPDPIPATPEPPAQIGDGRLEAMILTPNGDSSALTGAPLHFEAAFSRGGSSIVPEVVEWRSSLKNTIGTGNPLEAVELTAGTHLITVEAVFNGERAEDSVELEVGDIAVQILSPETEAVFIEGDSIHFEGQAQRLVDGIPRDVVAAEPDGDEVVGNFEWQLSGPALDAPVILSDEPCFEADSLPVGAHVLRLTVEAAGATAVAQIALTVRPEDLPDLDASITAPECGQVWPNDRDLEFVADATDGATLQWQEAVTGETGVEPSFLFGAGAPPGKYSVGLVATDSFGRSAEARCDATFVAEPAGLGGLYPDTSAFNPPEPGVTAISTGEPLVVARTDGLTLVYEEDVEFFDTRDLGFATDRAVLAVTVAGEFLYAATEDGLARCEVDEEELSGCRLETSVPARDVTALDSDRSIIIAALTSALRIEKRGETPVSIPWGQLGRSDPLKLASWNDHVAIADRDGVCVIDDVPALLGDGGSTASCSTTLDVSSIQTLTPEDESLWIGTGRSVIRWTAENGALLTVQTPPIGSRSILSLAIDESSVLWIGTEAGLLRYDRDLDTAVPPHSGA